MQHKQCIVVQNIKFSFEAACELFPFFYITQNVSVQAQVVQCAQFLDSFPISTLRSDLYSTSDMCSYISLHE